MPRVPCATCLVLLFNDVALQQQQQQQQQPVAFAPCRLIESRLQRLKQRSFESKIFGRFQNSCKRYLKQLNWICLLPQKVDLQLL